MSPSMTPADQPKKRSWTRIALIALGGLIALCVVCGIIGALMNPQTQQTANAPAATQADSTSASPVASAATDSSNASPIAQASVEPSPSASPEAAAKTSYAVGETGDLNGIKVTVNEAKTVQGDQIFKPNAGQKFVVVDVTFENTTQQDTTVSTMLQMELKDDTGQAYAIDLGATSSAGGKQPDGTIVPGDKLRGPIGYQIPEGATGLQWIFKEAFGGGRVVFDVAP